MNLEIRRYREDDYDSVNNIINSSFGFNKSKKTNEYCYEFVAENNNKIVGYFYLLEFYDIVCDFKVYNLEYLCVDETFRGMGIGKRLVDFSCEYAKKNGVKRIDLTSSNFRESAHKLYLSCGFIKRDSSIFRKEIL